MSGGAWDYLMGVMLDQSGNPMSGQNSIYNSGFNGTFGCPTCDGDTSGLTSLNDGLDFPDSKYYDAYIYATVIEQYGRRILGDAVGELGDFGNLNGYAISSWYNLVSQYVLNTNPLIHRGAWVGDGILASVFSFKYQHGDMNYSISFRVTLTPP